MSMARVCRAARSLSGALMLGSSRANMGSCGSNSTSWECGTTFLQRDMTMIQRLMIARGVFRVQYRNQAPVEDDPDSYDGIDVEDDFDDVIIVNSAQRRQAERLWNEILPIKLSNLGGVVSSWVNHDKHLGLPGVLYVVSKLRTFHRAKQALSILDWLLHERRFGDFNEHLYRLYVWVAFEARDMAKAERIYENTPPDFQTDRLKAALTAGYAGRNKSEKAEEMLEKFNLKTAEPYTALLRLYFRIDDAGRAVSLYKRMKDRGVQPNLAAYATMLRKKDCLEQEFVDEVSRDAEEAVRAAGGLDDDGGELKLRGSVASHAMIIFGYSGKEAEATRMWNHVREQESVSVNSYMDAIDAFGALGNVNMAEKIADEVERTKKSYIRLSAAMIRLYSRLGMTSKAEVVLEDLHANGVSRVFGPYGELISGFVENNQPQKAARTMKKALLQWSIRPSYAVILKMLPIFEKLRDAETAEDMVNRYKGRTDLRMYKLLLRVYISSRVKPLEDVEARLIMKRVEADDETRDLLKKLRTVVG